MYDEIAPDEKKPLVSWPPRNWTTITLRSFIDNNTGRDFVKDSQESVLDLFNPGYDNLGVGAWSLVGEVLKLNIDLNQIILPPGVQICRVEGYCGIVPVEVNLETGVITIDKDIADAVKTARKKTRDGLNIAYDDVHVNGIMQRWVSVGENLPSYRLGGYTLYVNTPRFRLTLNYDIDESSLEVTKLTNEQGVYLVWTTKEDMVERFNFEYGSIHITDFRSSFYDDPNLEVMSEEVMIFKIKVDGREETYGYMVDARTGRVIQIWIGIKIGDKEFSMKVAPERVNIEELLEEVKAIALAEPDSNDATTHSTEGNVDQEYPGDDNALDQLADPDWLKEFAQMLGAIQTQGDQRANNYAPIRRQSKDAVYLNWLFETD